MHNSSLDEIDTPFVLVDLIDVEHNIADLLKRFNKYPNVSVRPHQKTAKSPAFAKIMLENGARGICVAKISEAEVFVDEGIDDILITTEIAGSVKIARLFRLLKRAPDVRIVVDNANVVRQLNVAAGPALLPKKINVLIDFNVGQDRTGVNSIDEVLSLAKVISEEAAPSMKLIGIQGYEGHLQHLESDVRESKCRAAMAKLVEAAEALRSHGHDIKVVTTGGTGTAEICASIDGITEVQPGSFVFMDVAYRKATGATYRNALTVVATVISKTNDRRIVVDAGTKSLSVDMGHAEPSKHPNWTYRPAGDEYGIIESEVESIELVPGDRIELTPGHIDTTVALHDFYYVVRDRGENLVGILPISARGKVQ